MRHEEAKVGMDVNDQTSRCPCSHKERAPSRRGQGVLTRPPENRLNSGDQARWALKRWRYRPCCCCSVSRLCPTVWDPTDCSPPGSSVHRILQPRTLEWVAIPFSRGSSQLRDWTHVFCIGRRVLYHWATREAHYKARLAQTQIWHQIWKF